MIPGNTLIFLDEIQSCPRARTALKSLAIDGRADVIAFGSLLGLTFLDDDSKAAEEAERRRFERLKELGRQRKAMKDARKAGGAGSNGN